MVLGKSGTINQGVLQMQNNTKTSFLIEAGSNSNFEIYQNVSGVSTLLHAVNDITDMNLSAGHMYKINNVAITTDDITIATNK